MMNKKLVLLIASLCLVALMAGCGNKLDEAKVQKYSNKAEEVIVLINSGDFEAITAQFDDVMKSQLSIAQLEQITPIITASGDYKGIKKSTVNEKDGYYIAVLVAEYSNENRVYTITYDGQEQIAGLFVK